MLFGVDATNGPLQVALFLSAAFASLIAFKNGYSVASVADAAVGGVSTAMGAIFILLAVGALIGTWNMAGTIPTVVHYGIGVLSPSIFYFASAVICALVGMVTGSSWTTAGTLGVAFIGMSQVLGLNEAVAAGAIISGAYFGDKMTPLSETTILVPSLVGGVTVNEHIRNMWWTSAPALAISLIIFLILGFTGGPDRDDEHRGGAGSARERVQHLRDRPPASAPARLLLGPKVPTVPVDPGVVPVRRHPRLLHAVGRREGVRRGGGPRARRDRDQGDLRSRWPRGS